MVSYRSALAGAAAVALFVLSPATVRTASAEPGACAGDSERLCGHVKEGGGARMRCLMDHEGQLTPACRNEVNNVQAHAREVSAACSDDAARLCSNVESGKGRVVQCLVNHENQLTRDCRAEVA